MKTKYLFIAFSVAALTLISCSNELNDVLNVQDEQVPSQDSVFTYDMYFDSEIAPYEGTTRAATASDWKDGDVVYLWFGGVNHIYGLAEYISSSNKWRVTTQTQLANATNNYCEAWYGEGINPKEDPDNRGAYYFDYFTSLYYTPTGGTYTYANNSVYVNVTMTPVGARLRFKGTSGTNIFIEGLNYLNYWRPSSHTSSSDGINLVVGNNGYTDYMVLPILDNEYTLYLQNTNRGERYFRSFNNSMLKTKESGCFTIPTSNNLYGWTILSQTYTVNGVSFTMVQVEGGTFTMGATSEQGNDAGESEKPAHQVTLSTYSIGETEVTQELWQAVMGSNPSKFKGAKRPVELVSWNDCQDFIKKLNEKTGKTFRLPTEAEWEYAARGGSKSVGYKYAGSDNLEEVGWYWDNNGSTTHEVAIKQQNELGLNDMSGNVCEWCQDWYYNYSGTAQTNPQGPESGQLRVIRGGGWDFVAKYCRSSRRDRDAPGNKGSDIGLRLVISE